MAGGDITWTDENAISGVVLFDRTKRMMIDFERQQHEQRGEIALFPIEHRISDMTDSLAKLGEQVTTISSIAKNQRSQIDAELTTYKAEAIEEWRKFGAQASALESTSRSTLSAAESRFTTSLQNVETRLEDTMKGANSKVDSWIAAQDEQRQLEKPAELWAERAITHRAEADKWRTLSMRVGIGGLALAIVVAVVAFLCARPLFNAATVPGTADSVKAAAGTLRPTFHYELIFTGAITLAWLTMYLWAMRVLVRLYTTEHHLAIDASARGAMMEAYLGLIEAKAANKADRPIVLQALFRPVQDGMVRDDGPPGITPAALLSSIASAKGGNS